MKYWKNDINYTVNFENSLMVSIDIQLISIYI